MERLTKRDSKGLAYFDNDGVLLRGANGVFHQKKGMTAQYIHDRFVALDKALDRLAAYEDTGLTPEEIETLLAERETAGWISVEDRLPETNEIVRAKSNTAVATARRTESGLWLVKIGGQWRNWLSAITHWMPLPTPPDRQQTEN